MDLSISISMVRKQEVFKVKNYLRRILSTNKVDSCLAGLSVHFCLRKWNNSKPRSWCQGLHVYVLRVQNPKKPENIFFLNKFRRNFYYTKFNLDLLNRNMHLLCDILAASFMNKNQFLLYQWYRCLRINAFIFQKKNFDQPAGRIWCYKYCINLPSLSNVSRNTHWWHSSKSFTASEKTGCLVWNFSRTWQITVFRSLKIFKDLTFDSSKTKPIW